MYLRRAYNVFDGFKPLERFQGYMLTLCKYTDLKDQTHHVWWKYQHPLVSPTGPLRVTEQVGIILHRLLCIWKHKHTIWLFLGPLQHRRSKYLILCLFSYSGPEPGYYLDEQVWSFFARSHENVSEESGLCSSPMFLRCSSASPRRWSDKETGHTTPSEEE